MFLYCVICSESTGISWSRWSHCVSSFRRLRGWACSEWGSRKHRQDSSNSESGPSGTALTGSSSETLTSHSCEQPGGADTQALLLEHCPLWLSIAPGPLPGQFLCTASLMTWDSAARHSLTGTDARTWDGSTTLLGTTARAEFLPMDPFKYKSALSPVGGRRPVSLRLSFVFEDSASLCVFPFLSTAGVFSWEGESAGHVLPSCVLLLRLSDSLSQSSPPFPSALAMQVPRVPLPSLMLSVL